MVRYRKPKKHNPIELALVAAAAQPGMTATQNARNEKTIDFLQRQYNLCNIRPVAGMAYNMFWLGQECGAPGRRLFIKTGTHHGLYENEYKMGMQMYELDSVHFLKPLYYNDFSEINFFANEYLDGVTLKAAMIRGDLSPQIRATLIEDLYEIFCALRKSDIVHRDIRPGNLMIANGRLVLIDFQLAVSKSNYVELDYMISRPQRLRSLGEDVFRYRHYAWDDAHSLLRVLEYIGRDEKYGARYDEIHREIKSYIGTDTIHSAVREQPMRRLARHILPRKIRKKWTAGTKPTALR